MLDRANEQESLAAWAKRNGIDLGDGHPGVVGYWCRVSGVSLGDEEHRRDFGDSGSRLAHEGWRQADDEIRDEEIDEREA